PAPVRGLPRRVRRPVEGGAPPVRRVPPGPARGDAGGRHGGPPDPRGRGPREEGRRAAGPPEPDRGPAGRDGSGLRRVVAAGVLRHGAVPPRPFLRPHPRRVTGAPALPGQGPPRVRQGGSGGYRSSVQVAVQLLGSFAVEIDGRKVPPDAWGRRHAAWLVKLLALAPGRQLHRDQVLDQLWPEAPPDDAAGRLHKAAHYARRAAGCADRVVLRAH